MNAIEQMDETIEDVIESWKDDCIFEYEFEDVAHVLTTEKHIIKLIATAEEDDNCWEIYAEINDSKGEKIESFFDSDDDLADLENGRFRMLFENFFENNLLGYIPFSDEEEE